TQPKPNAPVRFRSYSGIYRSRFVGTCSGNWSFDAPLHRGHFVPLRLGEEVVIEAPGDDALLLFRSKVIGRDAENHRFLLSKPTGMEKKDRRATRRSTAIAGRSAALDGRQAVLCNLSAG